MTKKKIVFLTEHLGFGGAEVVLTTYLKTLNSSKYDLALIIRDDLPEKNYLIEQLPKHISVSTVFSRQELPVGSRQLKKDVADRILKLLQSFGEIHAVVDFSPILMKSIHRFKEYPMILWVHGDKSHLSWFERWKFNRRWAQYRVIAVLCDEMKEQLSTIFPSLQKKYFTISNPFLFSEILAKSEDESDVDPGEKALLESKDYVVSVGRLVPGKDFNSVVDAARMNFQKGIRYRHVIIGDGDLGDSLKSLALSYQMEDQVIFLGAKKNPYPWIKNSKFFVHSAVREGLPTVVIEALALGKAVIATRCPTGPRDILNDGEYGILWDLKNYRELGQHIANFVSDDSAREAFAQKAKGRAEIYSSEKVSARFDELIESLENN